MFRQNHSSRLACTRGTATFLQMRVIHGTSSSLARKIGGRTMDARVTGSAPTNASKLETVYVTEEYVPVQVLGTLLVLLTLDERDVFPDDDEDEDYEDE